MNGHPELITVVFSIRLSLLDRNFGRNYSFPNPFFIDLLRNLKKLRNQDGSINKIGEVLINWVSLIQLDLV